MSDRGKAFGTLVPVTMQTTESGRTSHAAAKALAQGAAATLETLMSAHCLLRGQFFPVWREGAMRTVIELAPVRMNCTDDSPPCYGRKPQLIESTDQIRIVLGDDAPKAGNVALVAFYNGWNYTLDLILFREGDKGIEGYNSWSERWIPLSRFRILGIVVFQGITSDTLQRGWGNTNGLNFSAESMREISGTRRWGRVRTILDREWGSDKIPMGLISEALGNAILPDVPRLEGVFVTSCTAKNILGANDLVRQYSRLYFEEKPRVEPRDGLLVLAAYEEGSGHVDLSAVSLFERDGQLWAMPPHTDEPIPPGRFRFLRACVGGENPDGLDFFGAPDSPDLRLAA